MKFEKLKDRMEYFRSLTDYKLMPNSYVIAMVDGHSFSKLIKKKFALPFDPNFIRYMNETAAYVCKQIQGCKFAYVQSDEISFLITDFDTPDTDSYFGYRLCKLQSLIASYATAMFNKLCLDEYTKIPCSRDDLEYMINSYEPVTFDCKVWSVPTYNDAYSWFLYRQNDCVRNSKQQTARTFLSHKETLGLTADEQVKKTLTDKGVDWNNFNDGEKYGRLIYKETEHFKGTLKNGEETEYDRSVWKAHDTTPFNDVNHAIKRLIPKNYPDNLIDVFVVSSKYMNEGKEEYGVNAVYRTEDGAEKMAKFLEETKLDEETYTIETKIDNFCVL